MAGIHKISGAFLEKNKLFWSRYKEPDSKELLLVEISANPVIDHSNAVVAKMVAIAKGLRIAWIKYEFTNPELMKSYSPNSVFLEFKKFRIGKIFIILKAIYYYLAYVIIFNRLLSFQYKGIPYGDFIYDNYLAVCQMATLHRFDLRIVKIFYIILTHDEQARDMFSRQSIKGVLVSHYIALNSGPLSRVAMYMRIPVYWKGGGHGIFNLAVFKNLGQIYDYPKKPSLKEIDLLVSKYKDEIEQDFKKFIDLVDNSSYGVFSIAYKNSIYSEVTREMFLKEFNLKDKPLIFVMLHAFNDHPHSHFKSMLFRDYFDWFIKTYRFALKDESKNWIFKQHPADRFYPTKDINLNKIMRNLPPHIRFIPHDSSIKASVVLNVADAIITCIGTAGVEMPALRRIPVIIAGDTFYDKLGFVIEPRSKEEYFNILANIKPEPIFLEQQLRAKCCFLYLSQYTMMPFAAGPFVTYEELSTKNPDELNKYYPERILKEYKEMASLIYSQFNAYIQEIQKDDFYRLLRLPTSKVNLHQDLELKIFNKGED